MDWVEDAKRRAAVEAVNSEVKDGLIIGLGSGSTVKYAIEEIGRRIRGAELRVLSVPSSYQSLLLAVKCGIPTTTLHEHPTVDLTIDGADQIDPNLNLIKGMGGALTREKILAASSRKLIIVADERKLVDHLGGGQPLPIEILPFAEPFVTAKIREMGGKPCLREIRAGAPYITDNGNFILDAGFGIIENPKKLNEELKMIPGVVETGLFVGMVQSAYIGMRTSVKKLVCNKLKST
ncbi:ribose 5-phosphate isomerase A [Candidatus Bathyarchaeota archaeon]|nr:ribose 5-phosphate isomerase A [Candidatus Bathyarchaeota archaeon]